MVASFISGYHVMRQRLKLAKSDLSPERALAELRKIQRQPVASSNQLNWPRIRGHNGVSSEQRDAFHRRLRNQDSIKRIFMN